MNPIRTQLVKIAKGALIAAAGATLAVLATSLEAFDWSPYPQAGPIIGALLAILVNTARKTLAGRLGPP